MVAIRGNWWLKIRLSILLAVLLQVGKCSGMQMDDTEELTRPNITDAGPRTFHWLCTVALLLIMPSISTSLSFAGRLHLSIIIQALSLIYAILEALILRFPDNDGVENRTSRGTAWFLMALLGVTVFLGSVASGTGALVQSRRMKWFASQAGERRLHITHRVFSLAVVLTGWVKSCMAPVAIFGFCRDKHTGQCIAHGVMGSAFVLYGFVYAMVLVIPWLRNAQGKYSQDRIDSWVMCAWGIVNTFTEHRWGREGWNHGDYQHTAMGIIWWAGGLLGIFLSRNGRRTFVPSLLIIFTGWAMSEHSQHSVISTKVHALFGLVLMAGGMLRIIEISFLLRDKRTENTVLSFQYLAPFCLVCSGILFMSANEEQLTLVLRLGADHSAYSLVVIAAAFIVYLWLLMCLELYLRLMETSSKSPLHRYSSTTSSEGITEFELENLDEVELNRNTSVNS